MYAFNHFFPVPDKGVFFETGRPRTMKPATGRAPRRRGRTKIVRRQDRSKLRYPSDLTDAEWALVEPLIPPARRGGGKRIVDIAR